MEKIEEYSKDSLSRFATSLIDTTIDVENVTPILIEDTVSDAVTGPVKKAVKTYKSIEESLESDFCSKKDSNMKKIMAAAAVIAKHTGTLPVDTEKEITPISIASSVDEGLNQMKAAYQVAAGMLTEGEAIDKLVDMGTARLSEAIDKAVPEIKEAADTLLDKAIPSAVEAACAWAENAFPPSRFVTPIIRTVTPYLTEKAKDYVKKGIDVIATGAKKVVANVATKVKIIGKKLFEKVFG